MLELRDVSFGFDGTDDVVSGLDLAVGAGERVALVGPNGSGKSTVAALAKGTIRPFLGEVSVDGLSLRDPEAAPLVGLVRQDPTSQLVSSVVGDEVAFGPRNLGLPEGEVRGRVAEALHACELDGMEGRACEELSGGQRQRLALAGVLALRPRYLVLDEVFAQLDSAARAHLARVLRGIATDDGVGILDITHDVSEVASADRVVVLRGGVCAWSGTPTDFFAEDEALCDAGLERDALARSLHLLCEAGMQLAGDIDAHALADFARERGLADRMLGLLDGRGTRRPSDGRSGHDGILLHAEDLDVRYGGLTALEDVSLDVRTGELVLVAGLSGSGKTTLARVLAGVQDPTSGAVLAEGRPVVAGEVGLAFQRAEDQLCCDSVEEDVGFGPRNLGCDATQTHERVERASRALGVPAELGPRSPFELSGGWRRRVALGGIVALQPAAYVLDEPTAGLDGPGREYLHGVVRSLRGKGAGLVVVSHDVDEWLPLADRVVLLADGRVVYAGPAVRVADSPEILEVAGLAVPPALRLRQELVGSAVPAESGTGPATWPDGTTVLPADAVVAASEAVEAEDDPVEANGTEPRSVDARAKVLALLLATVAAFGAHDVAGWAACAVALAACLRVAGVTSRELARGLRPTVVVLAFALLANALVLDGSAPVPLLGPMGVSPAGALRGCAAVGRIVLLVGFVLAVARTTTGPDVADGFSRLMLPLGRCGVPVADVSMVLSLALRFLPVTSSEFDRLRCAQMARGVRYGEGSLAQRLGRWASVLVPLVVSLFRRADEVAQAMRERCYGLRERSRERRGLGAAGWGLVALAALLAAVTIAL